MNKCKFISVVMSCYNAETYLTTSIDSILNQTFSDFEFIIWDDGSTDNTRNIVESYKDNRIRYFYHENTGLGMALRMACAKALCPIIARIDADDIAIPTRLEIEYNYLVTHPKVVLVSSAVNYINDKSEFIGRSFPYTEDKLIKKLLFDAKSVIVHPATMFRKKAYIEAGEYGNQRKAQDIVLFTHIGKLGQIHIIPTPLLHYRITEDTISSQTHNTPYTDIINTFLKKMISDKHVSENDVKIYNEIISLSKMRNKEKIEASNKNRNPKRLENDVFETLSFFLGKKMADIIIIKIKSLLLLLS